MKEAMAKKNKEQIEKKKLIVKMAEIKKIIKF